MNQLLITIFAALLLGLSVGCKKDPCKSVTCNNGATCADGTCNCTAGFTGSDCTTYRIVGKYTGMMGANYDTVTIGQSTVNGSNFAIGPNNTAHWQGADAAARTMSSDGTTLTFNGMSYYNSQTWTYTGTIVYNGQGNAISVAITRTSGSSSYLLSGAYIKL
jgi:hypothetical protein